MFPRLLGNRSGAAAVEMALIAPMLIVLAFGSMELGNYFYSEHVVVKAVRDGARFASRQSFSAFTCPDQIDSAVVGKIQHVTRTDQVSGGAARLRGWTDDTSVTVTLTCDTSGTYGSFFAGLDGVPVVKVSATVNYMSLFGLIGFHANGLTVGAESQVSVMGG